ncbi:MAG: single-stranded DNA-binding protein [Bradymonadaceae bacterium]
MSVNKAILVGNLGADPELKSTKNGTSVCNFSLATNERWTDRNGQKQEKTEWHRIVVWDKQADSCAKYLTKGRTVYVEGRIETREWEDREGVKRYTTEIVASTVQFLGGGEGAPNGRQARQAPAQSQSTAQDDPFSQPYNDDDIPF